MRITETFQIISFLFSTLLTLYFSVGRLLLRIKRFQCFHKQTSARPFIRERYYLVVIMQEWLWAVLVGIAITLTSAPLADFGLVAPANWGVTLSLIAVGLASFTVGLAILMLRLKKPRKTRMVARIAPIRHILPRTGRERWLWIALSISAGICEEVVFRGFLTWYFLQVGAMLGWPTSSSWPAFIIALTLSTLIFGLNHAYQGKLGILRTTLIGAACAYCYALTGSLLFPVILHALIDTRNAFAAPRLLELWEKQERAIPATGEPA